MHANKKHRFVIAIVLLLALLLVPSVAFGSAQSSEKGPAIQRINADYVELTEEHRTGPASVRAFIPTGSTSLICLVTLSESDVAMPGTTVFCAPRVVDGVAGVSVHILYPLDLPDQFVVSLALYQNDVKRYGEPVLYTGD
jgi:hypothetical protein